MPPASGTEPRPRRPLLTGAAALLLAAAAGASLYLRAPQPPVQRLALPESETAPMCPWREPRQDLAALFPGATGYRTETRILSGARLQLTRRLGRPPTAEEHALYLHRIERDTGLGAGQAPKALGSVVPHRVKGEYGAIELVVGVAEGGAVRGVRLQRLREPERIEAALRSSAFLGRFRGKSADSDWSRDPLLAGLPPEARPSAEAVVEGVRSLVILVDASESLGIRRSDPQRHH